MGLRTDEVEEMLFKIQDLLVPFLPDEYPDGKPHKLGPEV